MNLEAMGVMEGMLGSKQGVCGVRISTYYLSWAREALFMVGSGYVREWSACHQ